MEECDEVLNDPSPEEIGDLAWVLAMMLDQALSSTKGEDSPLMQKSVEKDD